MLPFAPGGHDATWASRGLALTGVELACMQHRAGHEDITPTLGYVKMAEDLAAKVGTPFGPFPPELMATGNRKPRKSTAQSGAGGGNRTPDPARMKRLL